MNHALRPEPQPTPPPEADLWVICLCAEWCHICRQMQAALEDDHRLSSMVRWRWVDIEEHADLLGDLDVETFPTYLIGRNDEVLLYAPGPTQPDAIVAFVTPYARGRMAAVPAPPPVQQALAALSRRSTPG